MKKGVVLSVNKFSITLLTPNGGFDKCRRLQRKYEIGEEISYQPTENPLKSLLYFSGKRTAVISAVVTCIMLFSIIIPRFSQHVSAYMTIDVNPSIELGLDDELQVVEMQGINADGKRVISQINGWENKAVSDVAKKIVLKTKELGYINDSTRKIIVSQTMIEDDKELDKHFNQEIKSFTNEMPIANTEVKLIHATESDRNKAKQQGISTGKFIEQKLNEENRKNEKFDLEKKNENHNKKGNVNATNSYVKDKKVSNTTQTKETDENTNINHIDQYKMASHNTSVETIKNHHKYALLPKANHSGNKEQLESKGNSKIKNNPGNKGNSKTRSNPGNKGNPKIKNNTGNIQKSKAKIHPGNKENPKFKCNPSNNGNSKTKGNTGNLGNTNHSWNHGHFNKG